MQVQSTSSILPSFLRLRYKPDNLRNPGRVLVGFNGTHTTLLGDIVFPIMTGSITAPVPFTVINEPSFFNAILGRTWIHDMKILPSSYYQMLRFFTPLGQIDIKGDHKATRACYVVEKQQKKSDIHIETIARAPLDQTRRL